MTTDEPLNPNDKRHADFIATTDRLATLALSEDTPAMRAEARRLYELVGCSLESMTAEAH